MSSDQARGKGFLSPSGQRKRSRTSFARSESRSAPRNHTRRQHVDRSSANGRSNSNSRNNTPPSAKSARSIGCRDEFLDDVHFDVAPKDMSIAASQEVARGDDSVVLQQLCSLGSVLAGGKCDTATAPDQGIGSYPCSRNGGHRGTSRNGSISGGNLLTRWLKPAATFARQGVKSRDTDRNSVSCETFPKDADVAQKLNGNGGTGGRAVGDLAKKALLRRKMIDAERGRRLRMQRESSSSTSTSDPLCSGDASELALAHPESTSPRTSCIAESAGGPAGAMDIAERPSPQVSSNKTAGPPGLPANPDNAVSVHDGSSGSAESVTAVTAPAGGGTSGIMEDEDEYGDDDFAFLTDADLQALEEDATRKSAAIAAEATASSQRASQQSVCETPTSNAEVVAIDSPSLMKATCLTDSGRPFTGSGSRPPLSVLGPNPKRSDRSGQNDSMSIRAAGYACSQGEDRANRWSDDRGRIAPGRGASQAWETLPGAPASGASSAGLEDGVRSAAVAPSTVAVGPSKLFTTFGSTDDFTRSTSRSRQGGQEGDKVTASEKGQMRPTEWLQQSQKRVQGSQGIKGVARGKAVAKIAGKSLVTREASSHVSPFAPAIVHRRFLVLEVTYAFRRREKVLIAIEQLPPGWTVVDEDSMEQHAQTGGSTGAAKEQHQISLLGDWFDCDVEPGDVVHVLFPPPDDCDGASKVDERMTSRHVVVDNASGGFLIVHPDILVSPTKVAETVICARKAVLQSRLASDASKSKAAVLGSLKHELFEASLLEAVATVRSAASSTAGSYAHPSPAGAAAALAWRGQRNANLLTPQRMAMLVDRIVLSQLEALYGADLDEDTARRELLGASEPILAWHRAFLAKPESNGSTSSSRVAHVRSGGFASLGSDEAPAARVSVSRVLATEDDVWSPVLGLKGIMDVTVEAVVQPLVSVGASEGRGAGNKAGSPAVRTPDGRGAESSLVMPVEVKTGKRIGDARIGHRAQVMLYTLLLRMRYGNQASTSGLLVYTSAEGLHTELVSPVAAELRALILARNRHAAGLAKIGRVGLVRGQAGGRGEHGGAALPPVIRRARDCGICFQNSECMLYHRAVEGGDEESSGLERGAFYSMVGHLSESHLAFFAHWDRTIDLEAKIGEQVRRTMWQESGPERESRTNKCMSDLVWLGEREQESGDDVSAAGAATSAKPEGGKSSKRFTHVFCREWATPDTLRDKTPAPGQAKAASERQAASVPRGLNSRPEWAKPLTDLSLSVGDMVCVSAQGSSSRGASSPSWGGRRHGRSWIREADHVRLLTGNISAVFEDRVEVSSDKRMRVPRRGGGKWSGNRGPRGARGAGAGDVLDIEDLLGSESSEREGTGSGVTEGRVLFRIDKDEWAATISMMRSNLIKLMAGPSPESEVASGDVKDGGDSSGDEKRRRLIVDLEAPRFGRFTGLLDVPGTLLGWSSESREAEAARELEVMFRSTLNEDQRAAVRKVVTAKDYALLLGMPGTGKTWTIAFAVRVLLARGASVLITSYTHSAVDNLLLKLIEEGVPCLRVGKPSSVHPSVRACCINHDGSAKTTAAYSELVASARVVGCTCLGVKHPLFSRRRFDYCIVDEAGQISQPVVLAPLRCADVFVLVGDHYQLPPLVTSSEALDAGMSESLFRRLCEAHPVSLQRLSYQYRMNADVMALCNDMTYSGRLRCGNARVEHQRLVIPNLAAVPAPQSPSKSLGRIPPSNVSRQGHLVERSRLRPWLTEVLDPARRVVFLDTDAIASDMREGVPPDRGGRMVRSFSGLEARSAKPENGSIGALVNAVECDVVCLLVWGLDIAGFDVGGVGTISPYRSQVQLLQIRLKSSYPTLEINTIDKYQGRDKEVIIVSFVRSNAEGTVGHLLRDWRRLNVALSRAKRKLVLIGSLRTLSGCAVLSSLATILETRGWVYSLPRGANRMYPKGLADPENAENHRDAGNFGGVMVAAEEASAGSDRQSSRYFSGNLGGDVHSGVNTVTRGIEMPARVGVAAPFSRGKESSGGNAEARFARVTRLRQRSAD